MENEPLPVTAVNQKEKFLEMTCRRLMVILLGLLALLFAIAVCIPTDDVRLKSTRISKTLDFSDGWTCVETGKPFYGTPKLQPGETLSIEKTIPSYITDDFSIAFQINNLHTLVYIDGVQVSEIDNNASAAFGKESGNIWSIRSLSAKSAGKTIRFTFENDGISTASATRILLGPESTLLSYIVMTNIVIMVACAFSAFIGILLIAYYHLLKSRQAPIAYQQFLYLGIFIINSAFWCFADSNILQLFFGNPSVRYLFSYFSFMLLPISLNMYFWSIAEDYRPAFLINISGYIILLMTILLLYVANIVHISRSILAVHIYIFLLIIFILYALFAEIFRHKKKYLSGPLIAFAVLGFTAVTGICLYYNRSTSADYDNTETFRFGILIFAAVLIVTAVRSSVRQMSDIIFAQRYKEMAYHDETTGGDTIQKFRDVANETQPWKKGSYAILTINLLRFNVINEAVGREEADRELKRIYDYLSSKLLPGEMLCRTGAEFDLLIKNSDENELLARYNGFLGMAGEDGNCIVGISDISASAYQIDPKDDNIEGIFEQTKIAYKNVKARHVIEGNLWIYEKGCREQLIWSRQLEVDAKNAIKNGEFMVYLQPKISPKSETLAGAEALVRWRKPNGTIIPPGLFIPLFENNGFISEFDLYMFEQTCKLLAKWRDEGRKVPVVSINVSKADLNRFDLLERYEEIFNRIRPPRECIELEFTESVAYRDADHLKEIIDKVHSYGATCFIDDFGSGYSNMNVLTHFDFDVVKLDKSFFDYGFPESEKSVELVSGIIGMLKKLGLSTIAEGIETKDQAAAISKLGCDAIQGYYYSKPIPSEEFEAKYLTAASM